MTDKAILNQNSIAHYDEPNRRFEGAIRKANRDIFNEGVITDPTQTSVGDTSVKHSSSSRGRDQAPNSIGGSPVIDTRLNINDSYMDIQADWPTGLDVGIRPGDFSTFILRKNVVDGDKMSFVGQGAETTSDLATLMLDAVSGELRSLLSDMLPTMLSPEAVRLPHFHSAAVPLPTTKPALSLVHSVSPSPSKSPGRAPSTFERGEGAVITSGPYGTHAREFGGILLKFLKNLLSSIQTAKPAIGGNHTIMMPPPWSARPMAFARYSHRHGQGVNGVSNEMEKRHHFPVTEATPRR